MKLKNESDLTMSSAPFEQQKLYQEQACKSGKVSASSVFTSEMFHQYNARFAKFFDALSSGQCNH